jgi:heme/copper-type cytochrome/quinol oxidase subunit 2
MSSTLSSVQAEAAQISSVNSLVLATIVIAIIVLVLEVVVLVRHR